MNKIDKVKFSSIIDFFLDGEINKAYEILFEELKINSNSELVKVYLAVIAYAVGNRDLSDYYIDKIGYETFRNYITLEDNEKLLDILLSKSIENREWENYRRLRNINEINRYGVTAPICNGDVLEVGCASGELSSVIAMHADNLFGIDIDPVAVELARYKINQIGLDNCFFALGDGANLTFLDNTFDTVVLAEVLEDVSDPKPFIEEAVRVCKSGGKVLISVPKGYSIPDPDHVRIFTKDSLETLISYVSSSKVNWVNEVPSPWLMCYIEIEKSNHTNNKVNRIGGFLPPHPLSEINFNEKVSIIIPTYNRANYLKESLDSVIAQTYPNKEIIVINDGSTDETTEILQEYKHSIKYFNKENGGKSSAINLGLKKATGDYIWIFDDDDIALPKKLEIQIRKFQENLEVGLIHTSAIYLQDTVDTKKFIGMWDLKKSNPSYALKEQLKGNHFFTPSVIVRSECYYRVGKWDEDLIRAQDYDMWSRICRYYKTLAVPIPTIHYRIHSGTRGSKKEKIQFNDLQETTFKYHQLVVKKLYDIPIEEVFSLGEQGNKKTVRLIEALLERALYMAKNNLVEECIQDLEQAKKLAITIEFHYINLSADGLQIINHLDKTVKDLGEARAIINILYFIKMIKKANS